jgi:NitT/TauT family transport system ATP-binding protein
MSEWIKSHFAAQSSPTRVGDGLISARDLKKWYSRPNGKRIEVLDGITLDIPRKTVLGILGPSGCGKSTLLRVLAGIEKPNDGSIVYACASDDQIPPIPIVLQTPALLPWRTVHANIRLSLELLGRSDRVPIAERYAKLMGLEDFAGFLPKDLSGGMKARVSIGRALAAASDLVILDEAFTELDEVTRQVLNDVFCQHVEERSLAAVVVSHDVGEAVYLSDEVLVLTRRPATIARRFSVLLPRPRRPDIRKTPEFLNTVNPIRQFVEDTWK